MTEKRGRIRRKGREENDSEGGRAPPIVVVAAGDRAEWRSTISSTSSCPRETFVSARRGEGGREGVEMTDGKGGGVASKCP